jgi:hypothetical protein
VWGEGKKKGKEAKGPGNKRGYMYTALVEFSNQPICCLP